MMHANWRSTFEEMDSRVLAEMETLEQDLLPPLWERVAALLLAVDTAADNAGAGRMLRLCDAETAAILAHFPGIAPAWQVVWGHLRNEHLPECTEYRRRGPALMEPLEPFCTLLADTDEPTAAQESA